jgi:pathogenesis-related protein 1
MSYLPINKIIKITALLLSTSLLLISCSTSSVVKKEELSTQTQQASIDFQEPTGEVMIDILPRVHSHIPEPPQRAEQRALTKAERFTGMLQAHNKTRAKHNVPPLTWSKKLEDYSMQWAKHLSRGKKCEMYHRSNNTPFGENLYRSTAIVWTDGKREINPVTIKEVVKAWTDEEKWYNYKNNSCQPGAQCGHYTQAVWKSTTQVGCAMQVCGDKSQTWVCSYNPPGNYRGVRPY